MASSIARKAAIVGLLALLVSCGDQSLFMSLKGSSSDLAITSVRDGQILENGKAVPLLVSAQDTGKVRDVEIEVTITSAAGEIVSHSRTAVSLNEEAPIVLPPDLPTGRYHLDLVLYSSGEVAEKKSFTFFAAEEGWRIAGIKSFPSVIASAATVMLKAELELPEGTDPYLRWSWKGKSLAKGMLGKGFGQVFWVVPSDEGVYTVTLEVFPGAPPSGEDFPFTSSLALSADIYVSRSKILGKGDLGPDSSYLSLLRLQANLSDAGTGAKKASKLEALPIGAPEIVSLEDVFGYHLDGSTGIRIPWLALPIDSEILRPFTLSLGIAFDDPGAPGRILTAAINGGEVSLEISMDPATRGPEARLSGVGMDALVLPWGGPALAPKQRSLLSLSVIPVGDTVTALWFLDGALVSSGSAKFTLPAQKGEGSNTIGGEQGFAGTVDEFGVYYRDPAGRASPDPDLFSRAQAAKFGPDLVLAEGFDGIFLPAGFALEGPGELAAGSMALAPGSWLELPALKQGSSVLQVTAELSPDSAKAATLQVQWEGSSQPPLQLPLAATDAGLTFRIGANGASIIVPADTGEKTLALPKPAQDGANLLLKIGNLPASKSALAITQLLLVKDKR